MKKKYSKKITSRPANRVWKAAACGVVAFASLLSIEANAQSGSAFTVLEETQYIDESARNISVDGNTALFGKFNSVHVYEKNNGIWSFVAELRASDDDPDYRVYYFGQSISLDGDTALIGTTLGSAYVFVRNEDGTWTEQQKLTASDASEDGRFGLSVAVKGDTAIIADPQQVAQGMEGHVGSVYVFERTNGTWLEQQKINALAPSVPGYSTITELAFGLSVGFDGETALIGANHQVENDLGEDEDIGAIYVYEKVNGVWGQKQVLFSGDSNDGFGQTVVVDGFSAVITAPSYYRAYGHRGAAYMFEKVNGEWVQQQKLELSEVATNDPGSWYQVHTRFAKSVDMDGDYLIFTEETEDVDYWVGWSTYETKVRLYERRNGQWELDDTIVQSEIESFATSVGLDQMTAIVEGEYPHNYSAHAIRTYALNAFPDFKVIPGTIEVEDFDIGENGIVFNDTTSGNSGNVYRNTDVDLGVLSNGAGHYVSWIQAGEWLRYMPIVEQTGSYLVTARVATGSTRDKTFHLEVDGVDATGPITFNTGGAGWQVWQDVTFTVSLEDTGLRELKLVMDTSGFSIDYLHFELRPSISVPGRVEVENFDEGENGVAYFDTTAGNSGGVYRDSDVDLGIYPNPDYPNGEGHYVSWIEAGEWLRYTLDAEVAGSYFVVARVATGSTQDKTFHIEVNGVDASGPVTFNTGGAGWQAWQDIIFMVSLESGMQDVDLVMDTGGFSIDFLHFVAPK